MTVAGGQAEATAGTTRCPSQFEEHGNTLFGGGAITRAEQPRFRGHQPNPPR